MSFEESLSIDVEMEGFINEEVRITAFQILANLTKVTPVDTGRARGNWFIGIGSPSGEIDLSRRAQQAISEGINEIARVEEIEYPTIFISNNLPYIGVLNDGSSTQAPAKFVETTVQRVANS